MRSEVPLPRGLAVALAASLLGSCSLGVTERQDCAEHRECQLAFGFGSSCGSDGLCGRVEVPSRCTRTYPADLLSALDDHRDTLVIGSLADRSLDTHRARERALELAITQANDAEGIEGRALGVVFCTIEQNPELDAQTREEASVQAARFLAEDLGVPAIVGPMSSSDVQAVFTALRGTDTVVISPSATSPSLSDIDVTDPSDEEPGLLWRTAPPDSLQGAAIAADMTARGVTDVAVIHASGAYGEGLAREFERGFDGDTQLMPFTSSTARDEAVATASMGGFDEVLFISSQTTDVIAFLNAAALLSGYDGKGIFVTDSAANADFLAGTRANASARYPQVRGTRPAVPSGFVYEAFVGAYGAVFSEDPAQFSFTAHAYDAAWMVVYGAVWAELREGEIGGRAIARGLRQLSSGRSFEVRPSTLQPIVQAFREGAPVDIEGASGSLDYDPATEETTAPIEIWVIDATGTDLEVVDEIEPS